MRGPGLPPSIRGVPPYPPPALIALGLGLALVVLIPARRLQLGGFSARAIGLYALVLWLLAVGVVVRPGLSRFLVPFLLVLYIAPFVAGPDRLARFARLSGGRRGPRPGGRPPMKDVTPPDERPDQRPGDPPPGSA